MFTVATGATNLTALRREVEQALNDGQTFEAVEQQIESYPGLSADCRSALWLWAWSHQPPDRRWDVMVPLVSASG